MEYFAAEKNLKIEFCCQFAKSKDKVVFIVFTRLSRSLGAQNKVDLMSNSEDGDDKIAGENERHEFTF